MVRYRELVSASCGIIAGEVFWLVCVSVPRVAVFSCLRSRQEGGCLDLFAILYLGEWFYSVCDFVAGGCLGPFCDSAQSMDDFRSITGLRGHGR